jgi:DNA-binding NarL/FixJ family response regulator
MHDVDGFFRNRNDVAKLTVADCRVAMLVSEGYENNMIAEKLGLSVKTVENQIHNIYGKMEARYDGELKGKNIRVVLALYYREWQEHYDNEV